MVRPGIKDYVWTSAFLYFLIKKEEWESSQRTCSVRGVFPAFMHQQERRREKGTFSSCNRRNQDGGSDEIALRDEILDLKRQVMILKRTNEQNLIKFRKYEDEAKRKDRQIEQLMDPRKNSDVTKILSTKGAAILMNLKDQNNSLIQMILTKDMQIRRLVAEIKTSKLYTASRKTESHKAEVIRLRNLLVKSQEILRENIQGLQQKQDIHGAEQGDRFQQRLHYLSGNSASNMSSGSERSSPREVEELRFTIQSMETHIKYSNDLLAKKNQQIMNLTEELSTLKKMYQRNPGKKVSIEHNSVYNQFYGIQDLSKSHEWNDPKPETLLKQSITANESVLNLIEKTVIRVDESHHDVPYSAPPTFVRYSESDDSTRNQNNLFRAQEADRGNVRKLEIAIDEDEHESLTNGLPSVPPRTYTVRKHQTKETSQPAAKPSKKVKEKWRNTMNKCKQCKKQMPKKSAAESKALKKVQVKNSCKKVETQSESSDLEIYEFEIMEKEIQDDYGSPGRKIEELKYFHHNNIRGGEDNEDEEDRKTRKTVELQLEKTNECLMKAQERNSGKEVTESVNSDSFNIECGESEQNGISPTSFLHVNGDSSPTAEDEREKENFTKSTVPNTPTNSVGAAEERKNHVQGSEILAEDIQQIKIDICKMSPEYSPDIQRELQSLYDNITAYEEIEELKEKSPRPAGFRRQSFDSSFDSDNSYPIKRETQIVQVEVEINSVPEECGDGNRERDHDGATPPATAGEKYQIETGNYDADDDINDDEHVTDELEKEDAGSNNNDAIDDDDDDVIVR